MSKRNAKAAVILAGLLVTSMPVAADGALYRWKDSEGNPVMSDRPPPVGTEYETVSTRSSGLKAAEKRAPSAAAAPGPKPETPAPTATKNTLHEKNAEYCADARKNMEVLARSPRIRMPDGKGGLRYLSDEEREAEKQKNLDVIATHCE